MQVILLLFVHVFFFLIAQRITKMPLLKISSQVFFQKQCHDTPHNVLGILQKKKNTETSFLLIK